jgi:hypothetical protein
VGHALPSLHAPTHLAASETEPIAERGVGLETIPDEGTAEWADLHRRLEAGPFRARG